VLQGKFITMSAYIRKNSHSQINSLKMYHKPLHKQEQAKPQISIWKELVKIMAEINGIATKKLYKE
jgi:hypothetical protein